MDQYLELVTQQFVAPSARSVARKERKQLLRTFWIGVIALFLVAGFTIKDPSFSTILGAILIAFTALLPSYLWCSGRALGLPIFPLFALLYLWTHALQLVNHNASVVTYSPDNQLFAAVTVAGFLGLGTLVWFPFVKSAGKPPKFYRAFSGKKGELFFFIAICLNIFFDMSRLGGWLYSGTFYSLLRGVIIGINTLSIFVLSYRWGAKELAPGKSKVFLILLIVLLLINAINLALVGPIGMTLLAILAFIAGRRKVPWTSIIIAFLCFAFLHYGKGDLRVKYWWGNQAYFVQPWEYPALYSEWIGNSFNKFNAEIVNAQYSETPKKQQSIVERSSLIHILLMVQKRTPTEVPYLDGDTYAIIPQTLVPRFLNSNKIASHEGTYMLNIHYGLQTRKEAGRTTIGWGLLNEAYANFGLLGSTGLALILGAVYGQATRWSMHTPLLSSRSLFSVILFSFSFQTEFTAGVYVSALFQSAMCLMVITFVFMKVCRNQGSQTFISS